MSSILTRGSEPKDNMQLLDNAISKIKPYVVEAVENKNYNVHNTYRGLDSHGYFTGGSNGTVGRLRLDWQLADNEDEPFSAEQIADLMLMQMRNDLEELIEDGDVTNNADPLLKVFNGAKARGQQPADIDIFAATLMIEPRKKMTDYTLYLLVFVEWKDF